MISPAVPFIYDFDREQKQDNLQPRSCRLLPQVEIKKRRLNGRLAGGGRARLSCVSAFNFKCATKWVRAWMSCAAACGCAAGAGCNLYRISEHVLTAHEHAKDAIQKQQLHSCTHEGEDISWSTYSPEPAPS